MSSRQTYALVAISGLFFQLLLAGFHIPPALAIAGLTSTPADSSGTYRTIIICTANGLRTITLDGHDQPVKGDQSEFSTGAPCPLCQSISLDGLLSTASVPSQQKIISGRGSCSGTTDPKGQNPHSFQARGPPDARTL